MKHSLTAFFSIISSVTPLDPVERPDLIQVPGRIIFIDQSVPYIRENYVTDTSWIDYAYHWQTANHQIIHRWDNAHQVPLPTTPYHWNASPATRWLRGKHTAV